MRYTSSLSMFHVRGVFKVFFREGTKCDMFQPISVCFFDRVNLKQIEKKMTL